MHSGISECGQVTHVNHAGETQIILYTGVGAHQIRRSKVKCVHSGVAPCQRCQKSDIAGCSLSRPPNKTPQKPRPRAHCTSQPYEPRSVHDPPNEPRARSSPGTPAVTVQSDTPGPAPYTDKASVDRHLSNLSTDVILKSMHGFTGKYPEFAILNHSAFLEEFQSACPPESKTLLATILASSRVQFALLSLPWEKSLLPREHYAAYAREMLSEWSFKAPKLQVAQASLIMGLYEWGSREFHRAWIHCGIYCLVL